MSVQIDGSTGNIIAIKADYSGDVSIGGTLTYEDVTNIDAVGLITARNGIKVDDLGVQVGTGATIDGATNTLTFLTNGSESLRITSTGDVGIGDAAPNSNYGTNLSVHSTATDGARLKLSDGTTGKGNTDGLDIISTGGVAYFINRENANMSFSTNDTERLRIDSSGRLLLGTTTEGHAYAEKLTIADSGNCGLTIRSGTSNYGSIYFSDGTSGASETRGQLEYNHNTDALSIYTAGSSAMRIDSSGRLMLGTTTEGYSSGDDLTIATSGHTGITLRSGTTSEGAVYFSDATSGGGEYVGSLVYSHNTNNMLFTANGAERFRIESDGDLKFGDQSSSTANNSTALTHIDAGREYWSGTAGDYRVLKHRLYYAGIDDAYGMGISNSLLEIQSQVHIGFFAGSAGSGTGRRAERMRLDSSGRLLVGTNTSRSVGGHAGSLQVSGTDFSTATVSITNNANSSNGAYLFFSKQRSGSVGGNTILQSGDLVGQIRWTGADGTDIDTPLATIDGLVDGTPGSNDMPGRLTFSTTSDGASAPTERARINSTGDFLVGTTSHSPGLGNTNNGCQISNASHIAISRSGGQPAYFNRNTNTGTIVSLHYNGTERGRISTDGTVIAYNTSSDYRLKENIVDLDGAITRVKQLQPRRFNFIETPSTTVDGFVAHEAQTVVPEAVTGTHNEVDDDGNPVMQQIDKSKLVPLLTAALQEAITKIETLETKVAALEG